MKRPTTILVGVGLAACASTQTPEPHEPRQTSSSEQQPALGPTQYFRSFDRFNVRGVDPLDRAPKSEAHVTVTPGDGGRIQVKLISASGSYVMHLDYQALGDGYRLERVSHDPEEPPPWQLWSVYIVSGIEHTYEYFCDLDPSAAESRCVLARYVRAEPGIRTELRFPVSPWFDELDGSVVGHVHFDAIQPLPAEVEAKAFERIESTDRLEPDRQRLVRTFLSRPLGPNRDESAASFVLEFDTSVYPAEFVDFGLFQSFMSIDHPVEFFSE